MSEKITTNTMKARNQEMRAFSWRIHLEVTTLSVIALQDNVRHCVLLCIKFGI